MVTKIKRKKMLCINATEAMEADGEQTFQIGTFDVGEEELDPGGQI